MPQVDLHDIHSPALRGFGTIPWWTWNGDMECGEMRRQLRLMKEANVDGWMLFPRFGLEMQYLGHEYMTKVRFAVEESERLGLEVWLYDEYAWPSGNAQCQVGEVDPQYRWRVLSAFTYDVDGGGERVLAPDWGESGHIQKLGKMSGENPHSDAVETSEEIPISYLQASRDPEGNRLFLRPRIERVVAVPLVDEEPIIEKAFCIDGAVRDLRVHWSGPPGRWRVHVLVSRDYGILIDHLNPDAVKIFIRLTHEKYKQYVGEYFGTTIKGFFSDETRMFRDTSHRFTEPTIAWTKDLFGRLEGAGIRELDATMAAVFEEGDSPVLRRLRLTFWDRVTDFYAESFYRPLCEWAERHGMTYSCDSFSEDRSVIPYMGDYFKCIQYYGVPGFDSLGLCRWEAKEDYKSPKFPSSAAHQRGEDTRCYAEGPGLLSWRVSLEQLRRTSDWLYALGANRLIPNSFLYTANHEQLYVSPSYFFHWTLWPRFIDWDGYVRRLGYILTRGVHVAQVAVLYPTETLLSGFRPVIPAGGRAWHSGETTASRYRDTVNTAYGLLCRQVDFDYVDSRYLVSQNVTAGRIAVGSAQHRVLILAGHSVMRQSVWKKIQEFVGGGGSVIWVGDTNVIDENGEAYDGLADWVDQADRIALIEGSDDEEVLEEELVRALETMIEIPVSIRGAKSRRCAVNFRRDGDDEYLFVAYNGEGAHQAEIKVLGWEGMERCDLLTGRWHPTPAENGSLPWSFAPHESVLLRRATPRSVPVEKEIELTDRWTVTLDDRNLHIPEEVRVSTRWGSRAGWEAMLEYSACFDVDVESPVEECVLVLDDVEHLRRRNRLHVFVNDVPAEVRSGKIIDAQLAEADLAQLLSPGRNRIRVEYRHTDYDAFENLFAKRRSPAPQIRPRLFGRFLVREKRLVPLPQPLGEVSAADLVPHGLAYYSGRVKYSQRFSLDKGAILIGVAIEDLANHAVVRVDGSEAGLILWRPYRCHCDVELDRGEHVLELEITNTQANQMFEEPRPIGLLGGVTLIFRARE